ncbi:putative membrane protein [Sediminihabitans luteus]|uniref:Putative membrane protein n=1 Tax=Sediminihabitans luteus TaxID=1138585 RepID=A0A2M9D0A4_9CELL|nr:hypothetical protein [Sediminihabitans luteus]PJJ77577.1 putative membrane protein [Sediminihabitans luteus]GII98477.1 membrane protein [Sediminihabitans luteus]
MPRDSRPLPALALAGALTATGVLHLVRPRTFEPLIPRRLGSPRAWVLGSGVAELACAAAVAAPATRRAGGLATAALFVAVFPGNVTMALASHPGARSWAMRPAVAWGRLPFQVPLVAWALRVARTAGGAS